MFVDCWTTVSGKPSPGTITPNNRNDDAGLDEIISDEIIEFKAVGDCKLDHKVRVICVRINPHTSRSKYAGGSSGVDSDGILRITTNLLDVAADVIAWPDGRVAAIDHDH